MSRVLEWLVVAYLLVCAVLAVLLGLAGVALWAGCWLVARGARALGMGHALPRH